MTTPQQPAKKPTPDVDLGGSFTAIRRAAQRARQVAQQTGTDLIVVRAGKIVRIPPEPDKRA